MADGKAREAIRDFSLQLLDLTDLDNLTKDTALHKAFTPALLASMKAETQQFTDYVYGPGEKLATLIAAPFSFMDAKLAALYGVPYSGTGFQKLSFTAKEPRAGILTHASVLATKATPVDPDLILRGELAVKNFLCLELRPPPGLVVGDLPTGINLTRRQALEQHRTDPVCAGCHRLFDPFGLGLENYDAIGKYRTLDNGKAVDSTGEVSGTDVDGKFNGAVEMAEKLSRSRNVADCAVVQWTRFALGRETDHDRALGALKDKFELSGRGLRDLLVSIAASDLMQYRAGGQP